MLIWITSGESPRATGPRLTGDQVVQVLEKLRDLPPDTEVITVDSLDAFKQLLPRHQKAGKQTPKPTS